MELNFDPSRGERQLFLDESGIARMDDLVRTMHQPIKKGALIRPDLDAGQFCLQIRTAPIWDPEAQLFKLWDGGARRESSDGYHWKVVAPHEGPAAVVYDASDPDPQRRFKAFAPAERAVSPDGISWSKLQQAPVPSSDEHNFSFDERSRLFIATVKHLGPRGRSVWLSTSSDFASWSAPELIFHADEPDQLLGREHIAQRFANPALQQPYFNFPPTYRVEIYNMAAFRYESHYIGMPMMYHQTGKVAGNWPEFPAWEIPPELRLIFQRDGDWSGFHHVQLACSRDLRQWQRLGQRRPFLDLSPLGGDDLDLASVVGPSFPLVRGGELWFYYTAGNQYGGPEPQRGKERERCGICLAVLRRDGFVSLASGAREGVLLTRPFRFAGKKIYANVDAPKGELQAEIVAPDGTTICSSHPLRGDQLQGEFRWRQGDLNNIQNGVLALRFKMRQAHFYSYWIE